VSLKRRARSSYSQLQPKRSYEATTSAMSRRMRMTAMCSPSNTCTQRHKYGHWTTKPRLLRKSPPNQSRLSPCIVFVDELVSRVVGDHPDADPGARSVWSGDDDSIGLCQPLKHVAISPLAPLGAYRVTGCRSRSSRYYRVDCIPIHTIPGEAHPIGGDVIAGII
jgi:hypothetical protein